MINVPTFPDYHGHLLEQDQGDSQGHAEHGAEHLGKGEKLNKSLEDTALLCITCHSWKDLCGNNVNVL